MSLGENISRLRSQKNMSQGDLASELGVSRQSISKWETDGSVPELEKLVKLSQIFGVSLDELVMDKRKEAVQEPQINRTNTETQSQDKPEKGPSRKTVGTILLCTGAVILILLTMLGGFLSGLLFASPFLLCGAVCLICKRNTGLWCAWALFFAVNVYLRYATGIRWTLTLYRLNYEPSMNYMRLAFAWIELICINVLMIVTIIRFGKTPLVLSKRNLFLQAVEVVVFGLLFIPVKHDPLSTIANISYIFKDWIRMPLLTVLLTNTLRFIRTKKAKNPESA